MNKLTRILGVLALTAITFLAACSNHQGTSNTNDEASLKIVTTFYPMQALTNAVVGQDAGVTVMMENADAHEYEPSARDIATLNEADVFVYNSEDMETFVPTLLESIDNPDLTIIKAASDIALIDGDVETVGETTSEEEHTDEDTDAETEEDHDHEGHSHETDPHTWLDPVNAVTEAQTIANVLTEVDPENAETYQENTRQFASDMMAVHDEYASLFESAETKTFLTQHAAFGYLANRYGLHQVAVTGVTESAEPSPKRIAEIVSYMEENNISVIYGQAGGATEIAKTIASEVGGTVGELQSMESVDTSQYPADGTGFIAIMKDNLESLAEGVQ